MKEAETCSRFTTFILLSLIVVQLFNMWRNTTKIPTILYLTGYKREVLEIWDYVKFGSEAWVLKKRERNNV